MTPGIPHPEPGVPDTRGPLQYIWWLARSQPWRVLRGSIIGTAWMVGLAVRPYLLARAIDEGLRAHNNRALLLWSKRTHQLALRNFVFDRAFAFPTPDEERNLVKIEGTSGQLTR